MLIGVVSDSHGRVDLAQAGVRMLESLQVDRVLHCGDIGSVEVAELFAAWPTDFVFGNCDFNRDELAQGIAAVGQTCHGVFGELEIAGRRVALLHSDDHRRFAEVTNSGAWDLVCYGHSHVAKVEHIGDSLVVNPGALYRANPHSVAIVELPKLTATIIPL